jgi:hypothetical protein
MMVDADGVGWHALCSSVVQVVARVRSVLISDTHTSVARLDILRDDAPVIERCSAGVWPPVPILPHLICGAGVGLVLAMHSVTSTHGNHARRGLWQTRIRIQRYATITMSYLRQCWASRSAIATLMEDSTVSLGRALPALSGAWTVTEIRRSDPLILLVYNAINAFARRALFR